MKNFKKLIILSSLCVTSLVYAQNYGYNQNSQNPYDQNYPSQSYNQQGQYRNNGDRSDDQPYSNNSQRTTRQEGSNTNSYEQGNRSNGIGSDNKPNEPDDALTTRVTQNIKNSPYFSKSAQYVEVQTKDGIVTLKGKVASKNEKNQIESLVKKVEGVKSVRNDLETEK